MPAPLLCSHIRAEQVCSYIAAEQVCSYYMEQSKGSAEGCRLGAVLATNRCLSWQRRNESLVSRKCCGLASRSNQTMLETASTGAISTARKRSRGGRIMTVTGVGVTPRTNPWHEKLPTRRRYLMCEPRYFDVRYTINPWMDPTVPVDAELALKQWRFLVETYRRLGHQIEFIDPLPANPDMVFAANGATVANGRVYGAKFRYEQRVAEGPAYLEWLRAAGFRQEHPDQLRQRGRGRLPGRRLTATRRHWLPHRPESPRRSRPRARPASRESRACRPALLPPRHRARGAECRR